MTVDPDTVLFTEKDGDIHCPVYLNGSSLAELPERYLLNGIILDRSRKAALEASVEEYRKTARMTIFRVLYEPVCINHGNGWVLSDLWEESLRMSGEDAVMLLFLQDEDRNIIGCLPVNLDVDPQIN